MRAIKGHFECNHGHDELSPLPLASCSFERQMAAPLIRRVARHRSAVRYVSPRRPAYLSSAGPKYSCHQEREWTVAAITIRESIRESIREAIRESIIEAIREAIRGDERRSEAIRGAQASNLLEGNVLERDSRHLLQVLRLDVMSLPKRGLD